LTRTASKTILNSAGGRTSFPSAPQHGASVAAAACCGARAPPIETMRRVALFAFELVCEREEGELVHENYGSVELFCF